jgi:hypothetical protein
LPVRCYGRFLLSPHVFDYVVEPWCRPLSSMSARLMLPCVRRPLPDDNCFFTTSINTHIQVPTIERDTSFIVPIANQRLIVYATFGMGCGTLPPLIRLRTHPQSIFVSSFNPNLVHLFHDKLSSHKEGKSHHSLSIFFDHEYPKFEVITQRLITLQHEKLLNKINV